MIVYRWQGTDQHGTAQSGQVTTAELGVTGVALAAWALGAFVKGRFNAGWLDLRVCAGSGPVPPGPDEDSAAGIGPDPETTQRTWWTEDDNPPAEAAP